MGVCCAEGVGNSFSSKLQKKRFRSFFSLVVSNTSFGQTLLKEKKAPRENIEKK